MVARAALLLSFSAAVSHALNNGLARTPQMGYNSWYDLMGSITEDNIRETIDALVETGLAAAGYKYINIDDDWARRDSTGRIMADPTKWTNGSLQTIAEYAHSKGLLFGTYTDRGTETCGGRPAAQGHEKEDAAVYASWGVDYLKEDSCHAPADSKDAFEQYGRMRDALNATGRPILFSLCGWNPWYAPVGASLGNSWRIGPDDTNWGGVLKNIDINAPLARYAGPGGWNDPCLLLSDTWQMQQRVSEKQSRSQFAMWAVMASPLLISGNIRNMSAYLLKTYLNREAIAVSQDAAGKQGFRVQGGELAPSTSKPPAHTSPCEPGSATQRWAVTADGYLLNNESGLALNADNCGAELIYWNGSYAGPTCHGPSGVDRDNMRFSLSASGLLSTPMNGECVTESAAPGSQLALRPCNASDDAQKWMLTVDGWMTSLKSGACLEANGDASASNVWARPLASGSVAAVFLNLASSDVPVTCALACFEAMGFAAGQKLRPRDVWRSADLPPFTVPQSDLPAGAWSPDPAGTSDGGSNLIIFAAAPVVAGANE